MAIPGRETVRIVVKIPPGAGRRTRYQMIKRALQQAQDEMVREMLIKGENIEYKEGEKECPSSEN